MFRLLCLKDLRDVRLKNITSQNVFNRALHVIFMSRLGDHRFEFNVHLRPQRLPWPRQQLFQFFDIVANDPGPLFQVIDGNHRVEQMKLHVRADRSVGRNSSFRLQVSSVIIGYVARPTALKRWQTRNHFARGHV